MITIPTTAQIRAQIITDIESKIGQTIPAFPKAFFRVVATAFAGVIALLYRFAAWAYDQIFPQTATAETLDKLAGQYGIVRTAAISCEVTATATGTNGTIIPDGSLWISDGIVFEQDGPAEIATGTATVTLEALEAGDATNVLVGATISLVSPIAGIDQDAEVATIETTGEDAGSDDLLRQRLIDRLANRPQGGAAADYVLWAREVPGIVKAFAFNTDPGEVTVYPMIAFTGSRIPEGTKLAEVLAYLDDEVRRPLCATVLTAALTERVVNIEVTSLAPSTVAMRAAIEAAWEAYLYGRFPAQYSDEVGRTNFFSKADMFGEAAGAGARSIVFECFFDSEIVETEYYDLPSDELLVLGTVTWPV